MVVEIPFNENSGEKGTMTQQESGRVLKI